LGAPKDKNLYSVPVSKVISVKEARKLLPKDLSDRLDNEAVERIINILTFIAEETIFSS